ncbi:Hypothetical predicted protein [Paramuricea clavata]|uniref:Uncharacterized protein n=1 Tax=Paramuricea clavata TaxID=317549 RepID=A0A6S7G4Z1_PARCT|nr:Hypothetical predicted protein [Paramuricea clavata]
MNSQFEKACQVPLAEPLVSVPELQLQQKKSKAQMKKERRDQYRKAKKRIEEEWKETEIIRCFGNRQSLKSRQNDRLTQAFEPRVGPEHSQETITKRSPVGYEKFTLSDDGKIIRSEFVVEGRKQPLTVIRENFLKSYASYMRKMSNEELSEMSREELIEKLVQVNAVFSDADDKEEYESKTKRKVDVQTIIESPEVNIVARSSSSDLKQLSYVETRLECLEEISLPLATEEGEEIVDVMRFFMVTTQPSNMSVANKKEATSIVQSVEYMQTVCMNWITAFVARTFH